MIFWLTVYDILNFITLKSHKCAAYWLYGTYSVYANYHRRIFGTEIWEGELRQRPKDRKRRPKG